MIITLDVTKLRFVLCLTIARDFLSLVVTLDSTIATSVLSLSITLTKFESDWLTTVLISALVGQYALSRAHLNVTK